MSSIAVIGAGLMGKLLAWRLSRSGMQVTVYERASEETPECAAWTAAAMVAAGAADAVQVAVPQTWSHPPQAVQRRQGGRDARACDGCWLQGRRAC